MNIHNLIKETSSSLPDPSRSLQNLERMLTLHPDFFEENISHLDTVASLFGCSQFLADFTIRSPEVLSSALKNFRKGFTENDITGDSVAQQTFSENAGGAVYKQNIMSLLRKLKKKYLLAITLRNISGMTGLNECTSELSLLAGVLLQISVESSFRIMREKFGDIKNNAFSVIGMGKLGAGELNYSSDIDLMTVYGSEDGLSSGIKTSSGVRTNRIGCHEYYCRLTETVSGLLNTPTEEGLAYRIDLRLRPNGQKGAVSVSLRSCLSYYEAWGKSWERVALIRARLSAGDAALGKSFMEGITPFVWKKTLDFNDIEEMKALKKKIDAIFDVNDIKRGYGGIREIEFFVQTFQLLYGGEKENLREGILSEVLSRLTVEGLLSENDASVLRENYFFFRRIEHFLQMRDDLQTYLIPVQSGELEILARKMNFSGEKEFSSDLKLRRMKVRDMYNSLFGEEDASSDNLLSFSGELPDSAVMDYLSFKGFSTPASALKQIRTLQDQLSTEKTLRERTLLRKVITSYLEEVLKSPNKDRALANLVTFIEKVGSHESYTDLLQGRSDTREMLIKTFSASSYFTRSLLSLENLEGIFEFPDARADLKQLKDRLTDMLVCNNPLKCLREFKAYEELKIGAHFLTGAKDVYSFMEAMSSIADTIISAILSRLGAERTFAVVALGGYGAQELNIGSDLDLIFIASEAANGQTVAEQILKLLSEYTDSGVTYKVDMRLRPDGSKGVLVNDIESCTAYYSKTARPWEIQSLIKARRIAGDAGLLADFESLRTKTIRQRRKALGSEEVKNMRQRIIRELSREQKGYDIKLGPGGIKEIEFIVQFLQLKYADIFPDITVQNTFAAIRKLSDHALVDRSTAAILKEAHRFLRTIDIILRLNSEDVLKINSEIPDIIITFLKLQSKEELFEKIENTRQQLSQIAAVLYK